jgi:anaerobic magnesium-protoporphyrin IX monomethyl ester cyclase
MKRGRLLFLRVDLIYPNIPAVATQPPLGLMYIAQKLRVAGHVPRILEGTAETIIRKIWEETPASESADYYGITCMSSMYHEILKIRDFIHEFDVPLIFGGVHATILPETLLSRESEHYRDYVVQGEGEETMLKIVNGEIPTTQDLILQGERIQDLNTLPFPARDLVDPRYMKHPISMLASRGCPFNCTFCQPTLRKLFGETIRRRNPYNVKCEMDSVWREFGARDFEFYDDTFTSDKNWVYEFCDELNPGEYSWRALTRVDMLDRDLLARMKAAGLIRLSLGIESGSQQILNSYQKGISVEQSHNALELCKKLGIKVHGFFMIGAIDETHETIQKTKDFIENHEFETIFVTVTTPTPCTHLYKKASMEGRLSVDWKDFDLLGSLTTTVHPKTVDQAVPMKLNHLSPREILKARYEILRSFYLKKLRNPLYLWKFIRSNSLDYTWEAAKNVFRTS